MGSEEPLDLGSDCDLGDLGRLPVLSVDFSADGLALNQDDDATGAIVFPTLLLYEQDRVIERLQAFWELHPMSIQTKINLIEHLEHRILGQIETV